MTNPEPGISPERLYTLESFLELVGWGRTSMRMARRDGLKVLYYGRKAYVLGSDAIEHILTHSKSER